MNVLFLKCFAAGVVMLVVCSALLLAGMVQSTHRSNSYHFALASPAQSAVPPARAASAVMGFKISVR